LGGFCDSISCLESQRLPVARQWIGGCRPRVVARCPAMQLPGCTDTSGCLPRCSIAQTHFDVCRALPLGSLCLPESMLSPARVHNSGATRSSASPARCISSPGTGNEGGATPLSHRLTHIERLQPGGLSPPITLNATWYLEQRLIYAKASSIKRGRGAYEGRG
jgi:hypothetical protein